MIQDTFQQVRDGAIGKLISYYATYYTSPVKPMPAASTRPEGISDIEWQVRNWYNFVWTCGDGLVEQAVHSVDKIAWAMNDEPPVSCVAVGGRAIPQEGGNIFDHFEVNYLYPGNVRAFIGCRQIVGCYNENADYMLGSEGSCTIGRGPRPRIEGKTTWTWTGQSYDMYQREHDVLFAAIRKGQPVNDGKRMATSTMLAIMGRMAAYTGQQITWDQALNSQVFQKSLPVAGERPLHAEPGVKPELLVYRCGEVADRAVLADDGAIDFVGVLVGQHELNARHPVNTGEIARPGVPARTGGEGVQIEVDLRADRQAKGGEIPRGNAVRVVRIAQLQVDGGRDVVSRVPAQLHGWVHRVAAAQKTQHGAVGEARRGRGREDRKQGGEAREEKVAHGWGYS
jgi:hypothetical protein